LPQGAYVEVNLWDMHGRKVADLSPGNLNPGSYEILWDASEMPAGIYIFKVKAGSEQLSRKVVLVR
ncbi:MAG: T9SS type A sorting domain-containing protein, partial [bacterium]